MTINRRRNETAKVHRVSLSLDRKLASYLAASASIGAVVASEANAIVVSNSTVQNVGINGFANIDFNNDGQIDFQIDHDRIDLTPQGGSIVDYLQLDKNDINGENNPLAEDPLVNFQAATFPPGNTTPNDQNNAGYLVADNPAGGAGPVDYPSALLAGAEIGPNQIFDFQEGTNVYGSGDTGRFNRLIDEDHGQVDMHLGGKTADQIYPPGNSPQFLGAQNQVRYLGVRMDLNNSSPNNNASEYNYGWIGIKITNEADATGQVVGYGYETQPGTAILAGAVAPGVTGDYNNNGKVDAADYVLWRNGGPLQNEGATPGTVSPEDYTVWRTAFGNPGPGAGLGAGGAAVPEPGSLLMSLIMGCGLIAAYISRRFRRNSA
jgi:hypothetical protein